LDNNEQVVFIWGNHDLVLLGADSQKSQVIRGVKIPHYVAGFASEHCDQLRILTRKLSILDCRLDRDTICIHNDEANDSFVGTDAIEGLLDLAHLTGSNDSASGMERTPVDPSLAPLPDKIPLLFSRVSSPEENWKFPAFP